MLARWLGLAALLAAGAGLAGCAGAQTSDVAEATGGQLSIYSSLPLQGPDAGISEQIIGGEKLALADAGGRAGEFKIGPVWLDDANPTSGEVSPDVTSTNAKTAAQDPSTIAYIGDYSSVATALSLPIMNGAGVLQLSPGSPYEGLTRSLDAGQDEPNRFYPTAKRTFVRLQPGDIVQAAAQAQLMSSLGVRKLYVLDDQEDPFETPLAELVLAEATAAGITVVGHDSITLSAGATYGEEVEKVLQVKSQAVFFAGGGSAGAVVLWRELHAADSRLLLLGSSSMVTGTFAAQLGAAATQTYLSTPVLPPASYPASGQRVLRDYARTFGGEAGPYVLYGYEAMTLVLDAIRDAGSHGDDRQTIIDRVFGTRDRESVIGRYSIQANGETTLSRYGIDRVRHGRPVFERAIEVPDTSG